MKIAFHVPLTKLDYLIKFASRGAYSHCSIVFDDAVYEARPFVGVRKASNLASVEDKERVIDIYEVETTNAQELVIREFLDRQIGKKYDYWMAVGFVLYTSRESRKSSGKWFCSELLFCALEKGGIRILDRVEPWKISPSMASYSLLLKYKHRTSYPFKLT